MESADLSEYSLIIRHQAGDEGTDWVTDPEGIAASGA